MVKMEATRSNNKPAELVGLLQRVGIRVRGRVNESTLYHHIALHLRETRRLSLDDIIEYLEEKALLTAEKDGSSLDAKRLLVFAIMGSQSMVYQPAFNICLPSELAIHHDTDAIDSGLVFNMYRAPVDMCDRRLYVLLKYFANLLPARSSKTCTVAAESSKEAASWAPLYPGELNAHLLHALLGVQFRWADSLALHLDYDKATRTLSLFSFPTEIDATGPRADEDDVLHFLEEVLLSFRLLFGQSAQSRRLFYIIFSPEKSPCHDPDTLLPLLSLPCTEKHITTGVENNSLPVDRPVYYAARHFPVLYERINILAGELNNARPKSSKDLLQDRRDTLQFWSFLLVALARGPKNGRVLTRDNITRLMPRLSVFQ
ncbi:hypothetical protein QBC37DRAFT_471388 [Rhypophila decipiens]|uniref:Uncharacterized protein n=1 Tax=Rhypophila decipiens TaxID=261697 RepID=A0AAN6YCG8_9PEZI|nr:hypothetical protein QBC37DRAFT_471388 [Rhypophila decipiens]